MQLNFLKTSSGFFLRNSTSFAFEGPRKKKLWTHDYLIQF